ncbi:DUF3455 domain-containing protein [Ideonella sp.]|uniref:DUF3455 domain-containing protein n=1 Tax=Ideonella sp. TaxID=1929293 RepID=UPI003BB7C35D
MTSNRTPFPIRTQLTMATLGLASLLGACSSLPAPQAMLIDNSALPEAVRAPAGHKQVLASTGSGEITYECRARKDQASAFEWAFVAPVASLKDPAGQTIGRYYAGPTWEARDGSKVSGKQVAVAPASAGNIPLQLVKADPAVGAGAMQGVSYIQRLATRGGVAPSEACDASLAGQRRQVAYQADYIFDRAS